MIGLIGHWAPRFGALGLVLAGCSGHTASRPTQASGGAAGNSASAGASTAGAVSTAGMAAGGGAPTGGVASAGTDSAGGTSGGAVGGGVTSAGMSGSGGFGGVGGQAGTPNGPDGDAGGAPPIADPNAILKVKASPGCGQNAPQDTGLFVKYTMLTSGTKDVNCADHLNGVPKCGAWSIPRDYYVWLPPNYDKTKAYPLVFEGPGCGGTGLNIYSLSPTNGTADAGVNGSVIRVGLTPPPNSIGHGTNENQGCFDDKEGDDSVDIVFYKSLIDKLETELCYDENRVFVAGNSSGAWLANELACKFAGATDGYAIRGVAVNTGGLPTEAQFVPTCTNKPLAGLWVYVSGDNTDVFSGNKVAVNRAMIVDQCPGGVDAASFEDFPIGGGNPPTTCKRVTGCLNDNYPLVVCALPGNAYGSHDAVYNPAAATFLQLLSAP